MASFSWQAEHFKIFETRSLIPFGKHHFFLFNFTIYSKYNFPSNYVKTGKIIGFPPLLWDSPQKECHCCNVSPKSPTDPRASPLVCFIWMVWCSNPQHFFFFFWKNDNPIFEDVASIGFFFWGGGRGPTFISVKKAKNTKEHNIFLCFI